MVFLWPRVDFSWGPSECSIMFRCKKYTQLSKKGRQNISLQALDFAANPGQPAFPNLKCKGFSPETSRDVQESHHEHQQRRATEAGADDYGGVTGADRFRDLW